MITGASQGIHAAAPWGTNHCDKEEHSGWRDTSRGDSHSRIVRQATGGHRGTGPAPGGGAGAAHAAGFPPLRVPPPCGTRPPRPAARLPFPFGLRGAWGLDGEESSGRNLHLSTRIHKKVFGVRGLGTHRPADRHTRGTQGVCYFIRTVVAEI